MTRRKFLASSIILGMVNALPKSLWANSFLFAPKAIALPKATAQIRHGLLQELPMTTIKSSCTWLKGYGETHFYRIGIDTQLSNLLRHIRLELSKELLELGIKDQSIWLKTASLSFEGDFNNQQICSFSTNHYKVELIQLGINNQLYVEEGDMLCIALNGNFKLSNLLTIKEGQAYYFKKPKKIIALSQNLQLLCIRPL